MCWWTSPAFEIGLHACHSFDLQLSRSVCGQPHAAQHILGIRPGSASLAAFNTKTYQYLLGSYRHEPKDCPRPETLLYHTKSWSPWRNEHIPVTRPRSLVQNSGRFGSWLKENNPRPKHVGLVIVERKVYRRNLTHAALVRTQPKPNSESHEVNITSHRTLLHEHHDFFLPS